MPHAVSDDATTSRMASRVANRVATTIGREGMRCLRLAGAGTVTTGHALRFRAGFDDAPTALLGGRNRTPASAVHDDVRVSLSPPFAALREADLPGAVALLAERDP